MTTAKKTPVRRAVRTKSEIDTELKEVRKVASKPIIDEATAKSLQAQKQDALKTTKGLTGETASKALLTARMATTDLFAVLDKEHQARLAELETLDTAIEAKKEELAELHGIEVANTSLNLSLAEHDEKVKNLTDKYAELSDELYKTHAQRTNDLQHEIDQAKATFEREQQAFIYQRDLERKKEEDEYQEVCRAQERSNKIRQEELEAGWTKREAALKAQEDIHAKNAERVANIDKEIHIAVSKAENIVSATIAKDLNHKFELERLGLNNQIAMLTNEKSALMSRIATLNTEVEQLNKRLVASQEQVADIAKRALDTSAKEQAFAQYSTLGQNNGNLGAARPKA